MSTHKLESQLKNQQYTFPTNFATEVMGLIQQDKTPVLLQPKWLITGVAASILLCMLSIYIQDGSLSLEAILGVSNYNESTDYYGYLQL